MLDQVGCHDKIPGLRPETRPPCIGLAESEIRKAIGRMA
jgi:hypothetical protein